MKNKATVISSPKIKIPPRWYRTMIKWDCNPGNFPVRQTNIPVKGIYQRLHSICELTAVSVVTDTGPQAMITFNISWGVVINPDKSIIGKVLKKLFGIKGYTFDVKFSFESSAQFKILLKIKKPFCDEVLDFVSAILLSLGVIDEKWGRYVMDFSITSDTMTRHHGDYLSFTDFMKFKRGKDPHGSNFVRMPSW